MGEEEDRKSKGWSEGVQDRERKPRVKNQEEDDRKNILVQEEEEYRRTG